MDDEEGVVLEEGDEPLADGARRTEDTNLESPAFESVEHLYDKVLGAGELELGVDDEVVCVAVVSG